ncbi:MAG: hypothetical protein GY847_38915 [Proteobacteria bacterium]|nr:hypothetical protein [Pseudomonadota bacterium]
MIRAGPNNPAGLEPGDVVLGYDGVPWNEILELIDNAGLPICGKPGTSDESFHYRRLGSVLNNAHLFHKLDVLKTPCLQRESIDTDLLLTDTSDILCSPSLPPDGVERACSHWNDGCYLRSNQPLGSEKPISGTVIPGTDIGYIQILSWMRSDCSELFTSAVRDLMHTRGLIIDQRFGYGGPVCWNTGLSLLFNENIEPGIGCWDRDSSNVNNEYGLQQVPCTSIFQVEANKATDYREPIALLIGPQMGSAGDMFPYILSFHPRAKRFGRSTDTRFGSCADWRGMGTREGYLLHRDIVAKGKDTVINAALEWIQAEP